MPRIVHFEIHADDPERCIKFYKDVFGWDIQKWESPQAKVDYWMVMTVGKDDQSEMKGKEKHGIDGGILRRMGPPPQEGQAVNSYVCTADVDDVDAYVKKVQDAGGKVVVPKMAVPNVGWLCYCNDTEGNIFGLMQPDENAK